MVDPGDHTRHGELLLGQQGDDQVDLILAGGRYTALASRDTELLAAAPVLR